MAISGKETCHFIVKFKLKYWFRLNTTYYTMAPVFCKTGFSCEDSSYLIMFQEFVIGNWNPGWLFDVTNNLSHANQLPSISRLKLVSTTYNITSSSNGCSCSSSSISLSKSSLFHYALWDADLYLLLCEVFLSECRMIVD